MTPWGGINFDPVAIIIPRQTNCLGTLVSSCSDRCRFLVRDITQNEQEISTSNFVGR
jgi:hypothetical protein